MTTRFILANVVGQVGFSNPFCIYKTAHLKDVHYQQNSLAELNEDIQQFRKLKNPQD